MKNKLKTRLFNATEKGNAYLEFLLVLPILFLMIGAGVDLAITKQEENSLRSTLQSHARSLLGEDSIRRGSTDPQKLKETLYSQLINTFPDHTFDVSITEGTVSIESISTPHTLFPMITDAFLPNRTITVQARFPLR
jgi:Flp pilus assembly protein TadG